MNHPLEGKVVIVTGASSGIGKASALAIPFVASLAPSEKARALGAPVEVNLGAVQPGELKIVEWQGKPVFILRRTQEMLDSLGRNDDLIVDSKSRRSLQPDYAQNAGRSAKPEILVLQGICTHLGCIPSFRPIPGAPDLGASWPGGFYCPCHGSKFDFAGRVFKNVPAPTNLTVPPYQFISSSTLVIGADDKT